jgi:hypothetical protein
MIPPFHYCPLAPNLALGYGKNVVLDDSPAPNAAIWLDCRTLATVNLPDGWVKIPQNQERRYPATYGRIKTVFKDLG